MLQYAVSFLKKAHSILFTMFSPFYPRGLEDSPTPHKYHHCSSLVVSGRDNRIVMCYTQFLDDKQETNISLSRQSEKELQDLLGY
jgi:hypothetical protein